jgi:hypothetical protein
MNTSDFDVENSINIRPQLTAGFFELFDPEADPAVTEVMESIHATPLGKLLRMIGSLPEIRHEKVFDVRRRIDYGQYDLTDNLDIALDRVLEEFVAEN